MFADLVSEIIGLDLAGKDNGGLSKSNTMLLLTKVGEIRRVVYGKLLQMERLMGEQSVFRMLGREKPPGSGYVSHSDEGAAVPPASDRKVTFAVVVGSGGCPLPPSPRAVGCKISAVATTTTEESGREGEWTPATRRKRGKRVSSRVSPSPVIPSPVARRKHPAKSGVPIDLTRSVIVTPAEGSPIKTHEDLRACILRQLRPLLKGVDVNLRRK